MVGVANGNATKIIVPSDLQNLVTAGVTLAETFKKDNKSPIPDLVDDYVNEKAEEIDKI